MVRTEENHFNNRTPVLGLFLSIVCTAAIMAFFMYQAGWRLEFLTDAIPGKLDKFIYFPTTSAGIRNDVMLIRHCIAVENIKNALIYIMIFGTPYFVMLWIVWKVCSVLFESLFGGMRNGLRV